MKTKSLERNISSKWSSKTLGDFLEKIEGGGTPSKEKESFWNGSIPWASVKDVVTHNPHGTQDYISEEGLKNSSSRIVPQGTLIVPTRMALGHVVVFNIDVAINQDLKALYPNKNLKNKYLYYWFQSKKQFIERLGSGSTVSGIQQGELKSIKFSLPPLPEQNRIVAVLETWDKAIENLTKKIEIKKRIKKGLMQELLSGKSRFAGFNQSYEVVKLVKVCNIQKGEQLNKQDMTDSGAYPALNGGINPSGYTNTWNTKENTITVSEGGNSCGYVNFMTRRFWCGGHCYTINPKNEIDNLFLYQVLKFKQIRIMNLRVGSGLPNIQKKDLDKFKIKIPKEHREQKMVANALFVADQEIELFEKSLVLLNAQKKYLLNNLITGAIRTPENLKIKV